jgi:hypothetical protein
MDIEVNSVAHNHQDSEGEISRTTTEFLAPLSVSQRRSKKTQFQQIQRGPKTGPKSQNFSIKARIESCRFFQDTIVLLRTLTLLLKSGPDYKTHPKLFLKNTPTTFRFSPCNTRCFWRFITKNEKKTEFHYREKPHTWWFLAMHCAEAASILLLLYPPTTSTTTTTPGEILSWNSGKMVHHRSSSEFMQNRSACHPRRLRVRMWCETPQNTWGRWILGEFGCAGGGWGEVRWGEVVCGRTWRSQSFSPLHAETWRASSRQRDLH